MSNNKDFKVKNGIQPTVYHEGVGTVVSATENYSLSVASYDSVSFSIASQETSPSDIFFKPDGTKMYILGTSGDDVNEYNLSTAWNVSTASYVQNFSVASQDIAPRGIFFKPDGTKMYVTGTGGDSVYEYSLSTAWDISTSSYQQSFSVISQVGGPQCLFFKPDGTKMYVLDGNGDDANEYNLSTAWDISTSSYNQNFSVAPQEINPSGFFFKPDGTKMYVIGTTGDDVNEYNLSTPWDISTGSYLRNFSVASQDTGPVGLFFKPDGTKLYVVGYTNDTVYQYSTALNTEELDLSTGSVFEVTPTSDIQVTLSNPADSGTVSGATLLLDGGAAEGYDLENISYTGVNLNVSSEDSSPRTITFNTNGTKFFMLGGGGDNVYQYSLSVAYNLSTASYDSVSLDVSSPAAGPNFLVFNTSGTKMYVLGFSDGTIYQYSLSTGFDISTASYDSVSFSVASQDTSPSGLAFKPDGTKLYMAGGQNGSIYQYSLSTAYDLSTTSFDSVTLSVSAQDLSPRGLTFKPDGTKLYIDGSQNDNIYQYSLSTAYDLSTASYDSFSYDVSGQDTTPTGLVFNPDGTRLYMVGPVTDTIYQYSTATPATITYDTAIEWPSGTAPTSPAIGETDVVTFNTRDGGSTYQGVLAIDGAK